MLTGGSFSEPIMFFFIELAVFIYLSYAVAYNLFFSVAALFYRVGYTLNEKPSRLFKIAIFIPAFKEDSVIVGAVEHSLKQTYPKSHYDIIVIADSLLPETISKLKTYDVIVHQVYFEKSTKIKSLQHAVNAYNKYEVAVVLDADNLMQNDFLEHINLNFCHGRRALQGSRRAKNNNTPFAILDGLSETIANHINRQGANAVGLSSPLIGSAMAFEYEMFKSAIEEIDSVVEDKELQIKVLQMGEKIHYLKNAVVLDEKVASPSVFENQRKRWISGHYNHFKSTFLTGFGALFSGNISIFNITILFNIMLPRILNLGLLFLFAVAGLVLRQYLSLPFWLWPLLFGLYVCSLALAIPARTYNKQFFIALLQAPRAFIIILLLHFKLKGGSKKFIHTPHKHY